jgi:hypothetical protein
MQLEKNSKRTRRARLLFTVFGTAITVLSLSQTGPGNGAGHPGERSDRIRASDVDKRDERGMGEILMSSSPA